MQPIFIQIDNVRINLNNVTEILVNPAQFGNVTIYYNTANQEGRYYQLFTTESGQAQRFLHAIDYCEQIHTFKG